MKVAVEHGNQSRFKDKFAHVLQHAESLAEHLHQLQLSNQRVTHDVLRMKQSTITELRSYKNPKHIAVDVMVATFLLLGTKQVFVRVHCITLFLFTMQHHIVPYALYKVNSKDKYIYRIVISQYH